MSQIRKYQTAGSLPKQEEVAVTEQKPTIVTTPEGRFRMGGKELVGQAARDAIFNLFRGKDPRYGRIVSGIDKAIADGQTVDFDPYELTPTITDAGGQNITANYFQDNLAKTNDSQFLKDWGATFNTQKHADREAFNALRGLNMNPEEKEETPAERQRARWGSGWFQLNKDGSYNTNSAVNADILQIVKGIYDQAGTGSFEEDDKYVYDGGTKADRQSILDLRDNYGDEWYNNLVNKLQNGEELSQDDIAMLKYMGLENKINENGVEEEEVNPYELEGVDPEIMKTLGISGIHSNKDENGNEYWTVDGGQYANSTWDLSGFNNYFDNTIFKNGWIHNGRLYTNGQENTYEPLRRATLAYIGNNAPTWNEWWDAANKSGVRFYGDEASGSSNPFVQFDYGTMYDSVSNTNPYGGAVWDFARKHNLSSIGVRDVTGMYGRGNWNKLYSYVDTRDRDPRGRPIQKFFNERGEEIADPGAMNPTPGTYTNPATFSTVDTSGSAVNGMFVHGTFTNKIGGQGDMTIMRDASGRYYVYRADQSGKAIKPISIDPTRFNDLMTYIRNGWTWSQIEGLKKPVKSYKNGGTIDWNKLNKLQYGGPINDIAVKSPTINNEKKSDITKTHNLNGSDGGLTEGEKWQIAGAIADLGGVVASFAPGPAGAAGSIVGAGGSTAKFIGDIKKDGFQWKDLGVFATNLAFDLAAIPASLVPAADNAIRTCKLVRTIKSVGKPILKWMGTIGASEALINTASKIINNEEYTSEDLIGLAQGLSGGIVAGKQWAKQVGDAKLASRLSRRAATAANAALGDSVKIGDKSLKYSELEEIVKNAKGDTNQIKTIIRNKLSLGAETDINLDNLGLKQNRQGLWSRIRGKEKTLSYEQPKAEDGHSAWYYFRNSGKRSHALGGNGIFGKKQQNLLDQVTAQEYNKLMNTKSAKYDNTIAGALRRAAMNNPDRFKFKFDGVRNIEAPWQFGWRAEVRNGVVPHGSTPYSTPQTYVNEVLALPAGSRPLALPAWQGRPYSTPQTYIANNILRTPTNLGASSNVEHMAKQLAANPRARLESLGANENFKKFAENNPDAARAFIKRMGLNSEQSEFNALVAEMKARFGWNFKQGGAIPKFQNGAPGGIPGKGSKLSSYADLADLANMLYTNNDITRSYGYQQAANNKLKSKSYQTPRYESSPLDLSQVNRARETGKQAYTGIRTDNYSDSNQVMAAELAKAKAIQQVEDNANALESQEVSKHKDEVKDVRNTQRKIDADAANEKINNVIQADANSDLLKSAELQERHAQVIDPYSYQVRQALRTKEDNIKASQLAMKQQALSDAYQSDLKNMIKQALYKDYVASKSPLDFETWYTTDPTAYTKYKTLTDSDSWKNRQSQYMIDYHSNLLNSYKKGGNMRPTNEQMAIDASKEAKRAVQKMNSDLMKIFMQLLKS